jgi:hypothetical protein
VYLANFPEGGAGFGAAGLTSWSMTIRTVSAQQVGDAAVAGRPLGGGELGAIHRPHLHCDLIPNFTGPHAEILSLSGHSPAESVSIAIAAVVQFVGIQARRQAARRRTRRIAGPRDHRLWLAFLSLAAPLRTCFGSNPKAKLRL